MVLLRLCSHTARGDLVLIVLVGSTPTLLLVHAERVPLRRVDLTNNASEFCSVLFKNFGGW